MGVVPQERKPNEQCVTYIGGCLAYEIPRGESGRLRPPKQIGDSMTDLTLLRRANRKPREATAVLVSPTLRQVQELLPIVPGELWSIDLETNGVDAADPACYIVGIGISNDRGSYYVNLLQAADDTRRYLKQFLGAARLTSFNIMFDGAFLLAWTGQWLQWEFCSYAYFKNLSSEGHPGQSWNLATAQRDVLGWDESNKTVLEQELKLRGLSKGDMWRLPADILGTYCAADADAAWQLYQELNTQCESPQQKDYHQRIFLTEVRLLAEQQLRGIQINETRLQTCHSELLVNIDSAMNAFLKHPQVAHHIAAHNEVIRAAWIAAEPLRLTKAGEESARWQAWRDREQRHMTDKGFNPNSKQQLANLFYDKLGYKAVKFTETGRQVVDRKVLPALGEPGKALAQYNLLVKRRGYVEAVIAKSRRDGCLHPQFNSVGTITTRLGGSGGLNLQQMPKDKAFLTAFEARPGHVLVQLDFASIEPAMLAEFSQDRSLLQLYGPTAKPNQDIYLYTAANIPALAGDIEKYYDTKNPTAEGAAAAKKFCKRERSIAKTVCLGSAYGMGVGKMHETLHLGGVDISLAEVRKIHAAYWALYAGIKRFQSRLTDMWMNLGGYVISALGRPIPVAEGLLKDIVNRHIQTSAHEVLQLYIWHLARLRDERNLTWFPWVIDFHDEVIVECKREDADEVARSFVDALAATNADLGMDIPVCGTPQIASNLAEIKMEGA